MSESGELTRGATIPRSEEESGAGTEKPKGRRKKSAMKRIKQASQFESPSSTGKSFEKIDSTESSEDEDPEESSSSSEEKAKKKKKTKQENLEKICALPRKRESHNVDDDVEEQPPRQPDGLAQPDEDGHQQRGVEDPELPPAPPVLQS